MIIALEGLPGSGKSTLMAKFILEDLRAGKPFCCNKPMKHGDHTPNFQDILAWCLKTRNGTVYIEEAGVMMARRARDLPEEILYLAAQARHLGLDIVLNFQHRAQIEPDLLRLVAVIYKCKKIFTGLPVNGFKGGGYLLNPVFKFVAYEPGETEPMWGNTAVLDWVVWRPSYAEVFKRTLIGRSQDDEKKLKAAEFGLRQLDMTGEKVNLR